MSEFIEVRCGAYRFLIPSEDIASIEFLDSRLDPLPRRRVPRTPLLLDGRAPAIAARSGSSAALPCA